MNQDQIHIAIISDEKYIDFALIAVTSILTYHKTGHLTVHFIHPGIEPSALAPFQKLQNLAPFTLDPVQIDPVAFEKTWQVKHPTWYRLELHNLLPDVDKLIYLDCDLLLLDDIQKFWEISLNGKLMGGIGDKVGIKAGHITGVPAKQYFNGGVLIMNLKKMRDTNATRLMLDTMDQYNHQIPYWDQGLFNTCFKDDMILLPQRWNIINSVYRNPPVPNMYTDEEVKEAIRHPGIVHFTGHHKPWKFWKNVHHPYAKFFWEFAFRAPISRTFQFKMFLKKWLNGWYHDSSRKRSWSAKDLKKTL